MREGTFTPHGAWCIEFLFSTPTDRLMPADTYTIMRVFGSSKKRGGGNALSPAGKIGTYLPWLLLLILIVTIPTLAGGYTDTHGDGTLTGWTSAGSRTWSESGGYALPQTNISAQGFLINDYDCQNDGTFTANIRSLELNNNRNGGIVFRYTNTTNFYYLALQENNSSGQASSNELKVFKNTTDWSSTALVTHNNLNFAGMNRHYPVKVVMEGTSFSVYLSDSLLGTFTDASHPSGRVGYAHNSQYTRYVSFDASSWEDKTTDYTWDISETAGVQTGIGTWGTDSYWSETDGDGTTLIAWPNDASSATFAGADGTCEIVVNGIQNTDGLTFLNAGYTLSTGTINLGSQNSINTAADATISAVIDGSSGIEKTGSGELVLSGDNVFTGPVTVSAGKIKLLHANALGGTGDGTTIATGASVLAAGNTTFAAEPLVINGTGVGSPGALRTPSDATNDAATWSGTITLQSSSSIGASDPEDQLTISGIISGSHQLTTDGAGTIVLSAANTFSGGLIVNDGILKAANSSALGAGDNSITVNSGAAVDVNGQDLKGYANAITINGSVDANTGALINTGASQLNAINSIALGSDASIGNDGNRFDIGRDLTGTRITGNSHTLTKVGSNHVAFMAEATGLTALVIDAGTISLDHSNAAGSAPITVNSGATLTSYGDRSFGNDITMSSATLSTSGNDAYDPVYSGAFTITGSNSLLNNADNIMTISGAIGGTGSIVKNGAGTVILSGTNTYAGATTVSGGTLLVNGSLSSSSTVSVEPGATIGGTGTVPGDVTIASEGGMMPGGNGVGTLTTGDLSLSNTSELSFNLGETTSSDRIVVSQGTGNLILDGRLNITAEAGFGAGTYTLLTYSGALSDHQLELYRAPQDYIMEISTSTPGAVELIVTEIDVAPTDISLSANSILEGQASGTVIGDLSATDQNTGESFTYALVSGTGSDDNASFSISGNQLLSAEVFDYDTKSSYSVRVRVTDKAGLTFEQALSIDVISVGNGLMGQYFDKKNFTDYVMARYDTVIDFDWGSGSPDANIDPSEFSIRWQGKIRPDHSRTYTFYTATNDGVRLWVNDTLIIEEWEEKGLIENSGTIPLTAGTLYDIKMEHFNSGGTSEADLRWSCSGLAEEIVPKDNLYPIHPPIGIYLSGSSLQENLPSGTFVGTFSAIDSTPGDSHTFSLVSGTGSTDNSRFSLSGDTLKTAAVLDYENHSPCSIRVRATDTVGFIHEEIIVIHLEDIMEGTIVTVDADGGADYTSLNDVINAMNNYNIDPDYVHFIGDDQDTYVMDHAMDKTLGSITFIGQSNDPDKFPIIHRSTQNDYAVMLASNHIRFERIIFIGSNNFRASGGTNRLIFKDCIVRDFSGSNGFLFIELSGAKPINFTNCLFEGNSKVFSFHIHGGDPNFTLTNCTFDNNTTVFGGDPNLDYLDNTAFKNCIFSNNSSIFAGPNLKGKTSYSLTSEILTGYGANCISGDPAYLSSSRSTPYDWQISFSSPAVDRGTSSGAPAKDISGFLREGIPDLGCWELQSADYTLDNSSDPGIQPASGTWGTGSIWTETGEGGTSLVAWPGEGNSATFAGADGIYTISVDATQDVDSITFLNSGYTIGSGTLAINGRSSIYIAAGKNAVISSTIAGSDGLDILGTGGLDVTGSNTFTGVLTIADASVSVSSLANGGTASPLGAASSDASNIILEGSTLCYTGSSVSCNRLFTLTPGIATVDASGSGELNLSNTGTIGLSGAGDRTLTLTGSNTGSNILAATLGDNSGTTSLIKDGAGTWVLTGNHSYSGTTQVVDGTLVVNGSTHPSSNVTVSAGTKLAGTGTLGGSVDASGATIEPGHEGAGTLTTGELTLNSSSTLAWEIGSSCDSVFVDGDLTLDGTLSVTGLAGFTPGRYTLMAYTGTLTDNGLSVGSAPAGYLYVVSAADGIVELTVQTSRELLPITVAHNIGSSTNDTCLIYTDDWSIIFDEDNGGGIRFLSNQPNGDGVNQVWNTFERNLFSVSFNSSSYAVPGNLEIIDISPSFVTLKTEYTLFDVDFTEQYTVYGSGRIFINVKAQNSSGGEKSQLLQFVSYRDDLGGVVRRKRTATASTCPYLLNAETTTGQFDILFAVYDLWSEATGFLEGGSENSSLGYQSDTYTFTNDSRHSWDFMIDFGNTTLDDTSSESHSFVNDYRLPDSLEFISGTKGMEKSWEHGLQGHWTFDDGSGDTARDYSGNSRHAHCSGLFTTGRWSGAIQLNGAQSAVAADNNAFDGSTQFTVTAWINTATFDASSQLINKHNGTSGWKVTGDASGKLTLHLNENTYSGTVNIADNSWHHVAVSLFSTGEVQLYVDGRLDVFYEGATGAEANSASVIMGEGFSGKLDDIRFYDKAVSENTIKSIYQLGYRSSQGYYHVRADNNHTLHVRIDGGNTIRYFPTFFIENYWKSTPPANGCVLLDGVTLSENTDYFTKIDNYRHTLTIALNKVVSANETRLYIDDSDPDGYRKVDETKKMSWGKDQLNGTDYFWIKNTADSRFGTGSDNQFYINWKMSENNAKDGEPWFMAGSVTNPGASIDTTILTNLVPPEATYYSSNMISFKVGSSWPKTSDAVAAPFTYTVKESSETRIVLRVNERVAGYTPEESFKLQTEWTVYPTGQIFRWDSVYAATAPVSEVYLSTFLRDTSNLSVYTNANDWRAGLLYSSGYPDVGMAFLGMKNNTSSYSEPFDNGEIWSVKQQFRGGFDMVDRTTSPNTRWTSFPVEAAQYIDMRGEMTSASIDSAASGVQTPGLGGAALIMTTGTLLSGGQALSGDLDADGFNEREGAYCIQAENNVVNFSLPARNDTCRFYPAFKITNYYAATKPNYVHAYTATDTVALLEGYQYNAYYNREKHELIIHIDSVFCQTVNLFISADLSLAVKMGSFWARGGDGCDTIGWRTESEQENLGYYLYRRVKPEFFDNYTNKDRRDSLPERFPLALFKQNKIASSDTGWVRVNKDIIPGAENGVSHGPRDYLYVDHDVFNDVMYEYRLEAVDYHNGVEKVGPVVQVMPTARMPLMFRLGANYPNPFRSMTAIRFELPVKSGVSLNIYNLQGRLVRKLVTPDVIYPAGYHQILWDGTNDYGRPVGSGPLIYRFWGKKYSKSRLMMKVD